MGSFFSETQASPILTVPEAITILSSLWKEKENMEGTQGYHLGQKVAHIVFILPIRVRHKAVASCTAVLVMKLLVLLVTSIYSRKGKSILMGGQLPLPYYLINIFMCSYKYIIV